MARLLLALLASAALRAAPASADSDASLGAAKAACSAELSKYCKGASAAAARGCLSRNLSRLSKDCRLALRSGDAKPAAAPQESCRSDAAKVCPGVPAGPSYEKCLRERSSALPAACRSTPRSQP